MNEIRLLTAQEIECRVGRSGKNKNGGWCSLLLYQDARAVYKRLDEIFGPTNWQNHYEVINNNLFCTIEIWDEEKKQWIKKQNVGIESQAEKEKGEASDALKRAAVVVGIGRELYTAPMIIVSLNSDEWYTQSEQGKGQGKEQVKVNSYVKFHIADIGYDDSRRINRLKIVDQKGNVRFELGKRVAAPQALQPQQIQQPAITDALRKAIADTKTREELVAIYNNNQPLHGVTEFVDLFKGQAEKIAAAVNDDAPQSKKVKTTKQKSA